MVREKGVGEDHSGYRVKNQLKGHESRRRETQSEAIRVIKVREVILEKVVKVVRFWIYFKDKPAGLPDDFHVWFEPKGGIKDDSGDFGLNNQGGSWC